MIFIELFEKQFPLIDPNSFFWDLFNWISIRWVLLLGELWFSVIHRSQVIINDAMEVVPIFRNYTLIDIKYNWEWIANWPWNLKQNFVASSQMLQDFDWLTHQNSYSPLMSWNTFSFHWTDLFCIRRMFSIGVHWTLDHSHSLFPLRIWFLVTVAQVLFFVKAPYFENDEITVHRSPFKRKFCCRVFIDKTLLQYHYRIIKPLQTKIWSYSFI